MTFHDQRRVSECDRARSIMPEVLQPLIMEADVVSLPQRLKLRAFPRELVHHLRDPAAHPDPGRLEAEPGDGEAHVVLPVGELATEPLVEEVEAEQVTLLGGNGAEIAEDGRGGAVSGDQVGSRRLDQRAAGRERVDQPSQARRDVIGRAVG